MLDHMKRLTFESYFSQQSLSRDLKNQLVKTIQESKVFNSYQIRSHKIWLRYKELNINYRALWAWYSYKSNTNYIQKALHKKWSFSLTISLVNLTKSIGNSLQKKLSFPSRISSENVTKSAVFCWFSNIYWIKIFNGKLRFLCSECDFGHIYWRNLQWKPLLLVQWSLQWRNE